MTELLAPIMQSGPLLIAALVVFVILFRLVSGVAVKILFFGGLLLLLVLASPLFSDSLLENLEGQYRPAELSQVMGTFRRVPGSEQRIVVLGGGNRPNENFPPTSTLTAASVLRLVEAVRLSRWFPEAQIVLVGTGLGDDGAIIENQAEAYAMTQLAVELGVDPNKIILSTSSSRKFDQIGFIKEIVSDEPFLLVTSAQSMAQATRRFREAGLNPLPAPTHFTVQNRAAGGLDGLVPDADSFRKIDIYLRELLADYLSREGADSKGEELGEDDGE